MNEWWLLISFIVLGLLALPLALFPLRKSKGFMLVMLPMLIGASCLAYWRWGAWTTWQAYVHHEATQQQIQAVLQTIKSPVELIVRMKARLQADPNSERGWYLLGRLYASQGQWFEARDAFFKAFQLKPDDEAATINYAQSLWQLNQQQFNEQIRNIFKTLLQKNPDQPDALAMLAMDAFGSSNYQLAIDYWQHLLKLAPKHSEEAQLLRKAIAKAQQKLMPVAGEK
ncbi:MULTISPECIES: tetratricopeptide repeat protein [Legionella]|uniref:Cytochrome c-type biogenesis protein n=1 Tax=Legionella maceachernii TaxID=466 RepID=A0A0W0WB12_9GAMM|nr:tetratricopeptide repeat protein [Legionella maceachernii]KTD29406.1 cytochrome c-type biogenesis protein [Legionella maceachernii]SJZ95505.1 Cytochrome c-type biogenesis protein CcmH/NrfG [Legionella maceachernii]SUP03274.1 Cytochrome c-type biogenesis protein CcmH precursor [Legionella maceachernii]